MKTFGQRLMLLGLTSVLAVSTAPVAHAKIGSVADSADGRIEFTVPTAWRCTNEDACVRCWNISDQPSNIVIMRKGNRRETRDVPAGYALSVCPP